MFLLSSTLTTELSSKQKFKEKGNTEQDHSHDIKKQINLQVLQISKGNHKGNINMATVTYSSHLQMFVIPGHRMPRMYHVMKLRQTITCKAH
jgi:hypothetical protein